MRWYLLIVRGSSSARPSWVSLENARRVSKLNGGRDLTNEKDSGFCGPSCWADPGGNFVEEQPSPAAESTKRLQSHCVEVHPISKRFVFLFLSGFGKVGGSTSFVWGRGNVCGRARVWNCRVPRHLSSAWVGELIHCNNYILYYK